MMSQNASRLKVLRYAELNIFARVALSSNLLFHSVLFPMSFRQ